jgi:N-acetylmuramoyl-L-alanine amidase
VNLTLTLVTFSPRHWRGLGARGAALALAGLLAGCAGTAPGGVAIDTRHEARSQDSRVLFVVLHYTVGDLGSSLKVLTEGEVSAHYLLSDEAPPRIYRLVDEQRRAWHAGASAWQGHRQLNASSIGIEIVNPGPRWGPEGRVFQPFAEAQIDALIPLLRDIVQRHGIRADRIVGHSDVQPQSKQDPGPAFPWPRLAAAGLIAWPDAVQVAAQRSVFDARLPDIAWFQQRLAQHGFEVPEHGLLDALTRNVVAAFQMKYRPARFDGVPDAETAALLQVLTAAGPPP